MSILAVISTLKFQFNSIISLMIPPQCCTSSKFKPVTHVIFDLDGTIIDSEGVYAEALQNTIEGYGKVFPKDLMAKVTGTTQRDVAEVVIELLDIDTTVDEFVNTYYNSSVDKLKNLELMPGAERIIRHLYNNNIPIAVGTSSNQEAVDIKINKFKELFGCFHHIVCGGTDPEVKNGKPAPDIFLVCASRFDEAPEASKCLVFEDSGNGVKAALAAGMQVVMIPEDHVPYEIWKLATMRLDSFHFMAPQLFGLPPFVENSDGAEPVQGMTEFKE